MLKRFGLGFAVGYFVGARSGRQAYERLADVGQRLLEVPWVEDLVDSGRDRAREASERIVDVVREGSGGHRGTQTAGSETDEFETTARSTASAETGTADEADAEDTDTEDTEDTQTGEDIATEDTGTEDTVDEGTSQAAGGTETGTETEKASDHPSNGRRPGREHRGDASGRRHGQGGGGKAADARGRNDRKVNRRSEAQGDRHRSRRDQGGRSSKKSNLARVASAAIERGRTD
jgi:hypothetical protein